MSENENTVVVDMSGLEDKVANAVSKAMSGIEEKLTELPKMQSANETVVPAEIPFDYRKGVAKMLLYDHDGVSTRTPITEKVSSSEEIPSYIKKVDNDGKASYFLQENALLTETIGTLDPDCCVPEVWADDIQLTHVYGKSIFWMAWFMNWNQGIFQKPGDTVHWCRIPPMVAGTLACVEPTTTAPSMTCPSCSLTGRVCSVTLCVDDIEDAQTGLVDAINEAVGNCLAVAIDEYFINVALSCTNLGTITSTGPMTGSLLIEAMGTMQMANLSKWKHLYVRTHITIPCVLKEPQKQQFVQNVDLLESLVPSKDKLNAHNVENILFSTEKETSNTDANGKKTTQISIRNRNVNETKLTPKSIKTCEKKEETYVTSANFPMIDQEHLSFMNVMAGHIDHTPRSLDNIQIGLSYSVKDVTMPHTGASTDWDGIMTNLNLMYFHFSGPNLPPGKAGV